MSIDGDFEAGTACCGVPEPSSVATGLAFASGGILIVVAAWDLVAAACRSWRGNARYKF